MYSNERTAITNVMARDMAGQQPNMQGLSLQGMLDDVFMKNIRVSLLQKAWEKFAIFDNIVAGLIGIMVLCKAVKWVINTLFHGKILYNFYGLSGYLLGALWDSVTTYFIQRKAKERLPEHVVHNNHSTCRTIRLEKELPQIDAPLTTRQSDSPLRRAPSAPALPARENQSGEESNIFQVYPTKTLKKYLNTSLVWSWIRLPRMRTTTNKITTIIPFFQTKFLSN